MTTRSKCLLLVGAIVAAAATPRQAEARLDEFGDKYHSIYRTCHYACSTGCDCHVADS